MIVEMKRGIIEVLSLLTYLGGCFSEDDSLQDSVKNQLGSRR